MATITHRPLLWHLRAAPTAHVLRFRGERLVADGPALAFWFRPRPTAVAEVPLDDRELPFLFTARTADAQRVTVQGVVTFRVPDPVRLAGRVDFGIDLATGRWREAPMEQVAGLLTQLAQQFVIDDLVRLDLRRVLADGVAPLRERIGAGLAAEGALRDLGLAVVAVRVAAVAAEAEVEQALGRPARERIQQEADEATFRRRADAVEQERAIAENELANRIALAEQEERLVEREGRNAKRRAEEEAGARLVTARGTDERERLRTGREVEHERELEDLRAEAEGRRLRQEGEAGPELLAALALRDLAEALGNVEHLTITPELLAPLLRGLGGGPTPLAGLPAGAEGAAPTPPATA